MPCSASPPSPAAAARPAPAGDRAERLESERVGDATARSKLRLRSMTRPKPSSHAQTRAPPHDGVGPQQQHLQSDLLPPHLRDARVQKVGDDGAEEEDETATWWLYNDLLKMLPTYTIRPRGRPAPAPLMLSSARVA